MTLVGFPDFQEQAQWQSPMASTFRSTINNAQTITFPQTGPSLYNVSNWQSVQVGASHPGGGLDVDLLWYDALPFTRLLGERQWTTVGSNNQVVTVPNIGPYLQITVTNNTGSGATCDVDIAFTNRVAPPFSVPSSTPMINVNGTSVGATTFITSAATYLYAGSAFFHSFTTATGWSIDLQHASSVGTWQTFARWDSTEIAGSSVRHSDIKLPPRPVRAVITNNDAGARGFDVSLVPDMFR